MQSKTLKSAFGLFLFGLLLAFSTTEAQVQTDSKPPVKKIEVIGSAELEIIPDEIYFAISLREYMKDNKNKVTIETLEKQLQTSVNQAGIPKENFQIEDVGGWHNYWQKKKTEDFLASKRYVLKLSDLNKINDIIAKVDAKGIESMDISRYSHSKIEQYRKEIKTAALKAAKEKARYLLEGIGEQLGQAIEIQEMLNENDNPPMPMYNARSNMALMQAEAGDMAAAESNIGFKKIKLKFEVRAVFAIK